MANQIILSGLVLALLVVIVSCRITTDKPKSTTTTEEPESKGSIFDSLVQANAPAMGDSARSEDDWWGQWTAGLTKAMAPFQALGVSLGGAANAPALEEEAETTPKPKSTKNADGSVKRNQFAKVYVSKKEPTKTEETLPEEEAESGLPGIFGAKKARAPVVAEVTDENMKQLPVSRG